MGQVGAEPVLWWQARKAEGNAAFKAGQHQTAIKHYTAALMRLQAGDDSPVRPPGLPISR
jgi:hypothetical protein